MKSIKELKELEKEIQETENKLEELKNIKRWMTNNKKLIMPFNTANKILKAHGYDRAWYEDGKRFDIQYLRKATVIKASNGRTNDIQELTYDEWIKLANLFNDVIHEELEKHEKWVEEQKLKRLEEKKRHDEAYKDLIDLDNRISDVCMQMRKHFEEADENIDVFETESFKALKNEKHELEEKRQKLMKEKQVKEVWHGYYKPV